MKFYSGDFRLPERFQAVEFIFRPLRASDVELDFDAVISSSRMLRAWSQSEWPIDGFTIEENLADLQRHEREHREKSAFTFTIMNPEETLCLGCIYLSPLSQEIADLGVCEFSISEGEMFATSIAFWVRQTHATYAFSSKILDAIIQWLRSEWYFNCVVFPVAKVNSMHNQLFVDGDFVLVGDILYEPRGSHWNIYQIRLN